MPEHKKGQKPSGSIEKAKVAQGLEKPAGSGEASGHMSPGAFYSCWNCGAANWFPFGWDYFYCWSCGALNRV